jgi:predicted amidohydrolase YtcJ
VTPLSPWWGLWSAVERREYRTGDVLGADETVDALTAVRWYTSGAAWAGFDEHDAGTLAPGRWADLIVLDRDPLAAPPAQIKDTRVLAVLVGGEIERADPALGWAPR